MLTRGHPEPPSGASQIRRVARAPGDQVGPVEAAPAWRSAEPRAQRVGSEPQQLLPLLGALRRSIFGPRQLLLQQVECSIVACAPDSLMSM